MTVCKNIASLLYHAEVATSFSSPQRVRDKEPRGEEEREGGKDRYSPRPLPLPPLTCKQASATGREGEGGRVHSPVSEAYGPSRGFTGTVKQHQLLAPSVVRARLPVGGKCVVMCMAVCSCFFVFVRS